MSVASSDRESVQSLLSLSIAAAIADPIPTPMQVSDISNNEANISQWSGNGPLSISTSSGSSKSIHNAYKHRRILSVGQSKKRHSDAREATSRPTPVALQTAASALTSLATLSLSTSSPPIRMMSLPDEEILEQISDKAEAKLDEMGVSVSTTKMGKKRGTIFKCESCSKVYRHPSCLIKHRWEHSPHWREASKFLLSKHQQVQLLEAAAILSHLSPTAPGGTSLPEDRALWPSYLSGGILPLPLTNNSPEPSAPINVASSSTPYQTSSSVPISSVISRPLSSGPRMHDYAVPISANVAHLRPGVVGVPTEPMPVHLRAPFKAESLPVSIRNFSDRHSIQWVGSFHGIHSDGSYTHSDEGTMGGWSLPNSSVRSESSTPPTEDEDDHEFVDLDYLMEQRNSFSRGPFDRGRSEGGEQFGPKVEEWDGMEMEMEL